MKTLLLIVAALLLFGATLGAPQTRGQGQDVEERIPWCTNQACINKYYNGRAHGAYGRSAESDEAQSEERTPGLMVEKAK